MRLLLLLFLPSLAAAAPTCTDPAATAHLQAGMAAMGEQLALEAGQEYAFCLRADATCTACQYEQGWAFWLRNEFGLAADAWEKTLAADPSHADAQTWAPKARARAAKVEAPAPYRRIDPEADVESTVGETVQVPLTFAAPGTSGLISCKAELASASRPARVRGPRNVRSTPRADVSAMPRVPAAEAPNQPGRSVSGLPLQPLEGKPTVLGRIAAVMTRAASGERTRISVWGASHTSADRFTGRIRRVLQGRGGDGGHGFVLPAELYKWHGGRDVSLCRTVGWAPDWADVTNPDDSDRLGVGGMSVTSGDPADFGWIQTTSKGPGSAVSSVSIWALKKSMAGTLLISVDGGPAQEVPLRDFMRDSIAHITIALPDGAHRVRIAPKGDGLVTVFGMSMERDRGVIVDALGIRGREARTWLMWDVVGFVDGVEQIAPDLVVLAYGTNEASDPSYSMDAYRRDLHAVLLRLRMALPPEVPCILAGPSDRFAKRDDGDYATWARTADVAAVQREVAPIYGCASWDWQAATGGPGSALGGLHGDPPLTAKDGIHHTPAGYAAVADRFLQALDAAR